MNSAGKVDRSVHNANIEELQNKIQDSKRIRRKRLINLLNYINFQDQTVTLNFKHKKFNNIISFQAYPQPCINERLECKWIEPQENIQRFNSYEFQNFILSDGKNFILVIAKLEDISEDKITLELPETCYELIRRRAKRYKCEGIKVEFIQNGVIFYGKLIDFSSLSFRVEISAIPPQTLHWINHEKPVNIILKNEDNNIVFAGECVITKQSDGQSIRSVVLELLKDNIPRFQPKK